MSFFFDLQLKVYAAQNEMPKFGITTQFIGYTLPETSLSASEIPYNNVIYMVYLYHIVFLSSYVITLITFYIWYNKKDADEKRLKQICAIRKLMEKYETFTFGVIITAVIAILFDVFAKGMIFCQTKDLFSGLATPVQVVLWMRHLSQLVAGLLIILSCMYNFCKGNGFYHGHVLVSLHFFVFSLVYLMFSAIILALAYPTQILATVMFTLTYLFATTTLVTILLQMFQPKTFKLRKKGQAQDNQASCSTCNCTTLHVFTAFIYLLLLLGVLCIGLLALYLLLIGKGSALNTTPHFVISLFPSALVSGVALIMNRIVFNGEKKPETPQQPSNGATDTTSGSESESSNSTQIEQSTIAINGSQLHRRALRDS